MKRSRFSETQIVSILKEADAGAKVKDLCRKHGISGANYYNWKSKYGGMEASDLKRMKELEDELSQYKRMYAELARENNAMRSLIEKSSEAVDEARGGRVLANEGLSITTSCRCVGLSRSNWYRVPDDWTVRDAEIIAALATLVDGRPSRGFWKCRKLLRRQGKPWNHKRIYRVYCQMKLNHRRRAKRRLPKRLRVPLYVPRLPDTVWSADFMSDVLHNGRRFRTFNVVDDFNRQALHIEVDTSITSMRLVRIFERLQAEHGLPQVLRTDNGPELLGEVFTSWAKNASMAIQYIQPGKPY